MNPTRSADFTKPYMVSNSPLELGDNISEIKTLKQSLHQKFAIKDLRPLKYFLGIEVATSSKGLLLNQRKYVLDLLDEANMMECKPARTPLASKRQWNEKCEPLSDPSVYQRMGSVGRGIIMKNNGSNHILAYGDADWAGNALDRKSTTGFCTFVRGNLVTWKSKKQTIIARSSAEVEYRAMAATSYELIWLKGLLSELRFTSMAHMSLYCDNQAAMHIASNPVFHEMTKYIEVDCHYICG
ncbi:unnamed protein product [Malus baccata var. baccata]